MVKKRTISCIIVHCSASKHGTTVADIRRWHKEKGWSDIGYHYVILTNGDIKTGRPIDKVGAHCKGHNHDSIGICLIGGRDPKGRMHKFTKKQFKALKILLEGITISYGELPIYPHRYFNPKKECPCFDIYKILKA